MEYSHANFLHSSNNAFRYLQKLDPYGIDITITLLCNIIKVVGKILDIISSTAFVNQQSSFKSTPKQFQIKMVTKMLSLASFVTLVALIGAQHQRPLSGKATFWGNTNWETPWLDPLHFIDSLFMCKNSEIDIFVLSRHSFWKTNQASSYLSSISTTQSNILMQKECQTTVLTMGHWVRAIFLMLSFSF